MKFLRLYLFIWTYALFTWKFMQRHERNINIIKHNKNERKIKSQGDAARCDQPMIEIEESRVSVA